MEFPDARELGGPDHRDEIRAANGRRAGGGVIRARNPGEDADALDGRREVERHGRRHATRLHLGLVQGPDAHVLEEVALEHVRRQVEAVRPDAELRIIGKQIGGLERVEVPATADRVSALRNRETLIVRRGRIASRVEHEREIGDDPPIGARIPHDDGVAEIVVVAGVAEIPLAHERVEAERGDAHAVALAKDADRRVDGLDVVSRSDVAVRVRRPAIAPVRKIEPGDIASAAARAGRGRWQGGRHGLRNPIGLTANCRQERLVAFGAGTGLPLYRETVRQLTQITSERSTPLQSNDSRPGSCGRRGLGPRYRASQRERDEGDSQRSRGRTTTVWGSMMCHGLWVPGGLVLSLR